jgi:pimeloyl-ACP methyl ester carboxylesterase
MVIEAGAFGIDYVTEGAGLAALVLHGAYSTRDEVIPSLGPVLAAAGLTRIYPDLPGMGGSMRSGARTADDVLDALDDVIAREVRPADRFVVVGHSFGALLARGVAARHPDRVVGMALVSPFVLDFQAEPRRIVTDDDVAGELDSALRAEFEGYFVVRTRETLARFRSAVRPALHRYNGEIVESIMSQARMTPDPDAVPLTGPVLILAGRDDDLIGWRAQQTLADRYPRGTFVLAADAGHALLHERPALVAAALTDWIARLDVA